MEIQDLFGLPAHPLVVHAAVVLLPLAALATVLCAGIPRARRVYGPIALALALAATLAVGLAQGSGEALEERVEDARSESELVEEHTEKGETVLPWSIAVSVAAVAVVAAPAVGRRWPSVPARPLTAALLVVSFVVAAGATWTVIDVGHSGAKATWNDVSTDGERG